MKTTLAIFTASLMLFNAKPSFGIIHYDGDDSGNITDPETGVPYYGVGRLGAEGSPLTSTRGSAVYLTGKYLLTADHTSATPDVTFDGTTYWDIDAAFTPIQIGDVDLKIIKLVADPELQDIPLASGTSTNKTGTMIAWGRGRDLAVADSASGNTNTWTWGEDSTVAKRWGTNRIDSIAAQNYLYDPNGKTYSYSSLVTDLDRNAGNNEAGAALYDSGSGIFIDDGGTWKLAGIATLVQTNGTSTFKLLGGDLNYYVNISSYKSAIENALPDLTTLSGWKVDHSLYDSDADNSADTDSDGIGQLLEFALGGDPNVNDISILPTHALVEDGGNTYLELTVTRPNNLQGITYTPVTTTDLTNWPNDSTGIVDATPTPTNNGDGTETLIYRRSQAVAEVDQAFIRVDIIEN